MIFATLPDALLLLRRGAQRSYAIDATPTYSLIRRQRYAVFRCRLLRRLLLRYQLLLRAAAICVTLP